MGQVSSKSPDAAPQALNALVGHDAVRQSMSVDPRDGSCKLANAAQPPVRAVLAYDALRQLRPVDIAAGSVMTTTSTRTK